MMSWENAFTTLFLNNLILLILHRTPDVELVLDLDTSPEKLKVKPEVRESPWSSLCSTSQD